MENTVLKRKRKEKFRRKKEGEEGEEEEEEGDGIVICLRVEKPRRDDDEKEKNKSTVENTRREGEGRRDTDFFPRKVQISRLAWNESRQWRSNESSVRASSLEFFKTPDEYRARIA